MSYLVMARRWRPTTFDEVIAQEHVTQTLQRALERGRVAHAYIFTGPRGVGKTSTARLLAAAVNSKDLKKNEKGFLDIDPDSPTYSEISTGNALDVIEIDGASNNKVEDIRQLRETVKYAPSSLEKKVYIIDEVHMLSTSAFNALLKTLEEPPEHVMFIFATTEIHKVPATVLSRCQRYDFKRIPVKDIKRQLLKIVEGDKIDIDDAALVSIAIKAEGAMRDALSVLDQLVAYQGDEKITGEVVRQALGLIGSEIWFRCTDMAATGNVAEALEIANAISGGGHDPREFLRGLQHHVMRFLFLKAKGNAEELDVSEEDRKKYISGLEQHQEEDLLRMGEWAAQAEDLLRDALDPQVRLELLMVRIARMDKAVDLGALLAQAGVTPSTYKQPRIRPEESSSKKKDDEVIADPVPEQEEVLEKKPDPVVEEKVEESNPESGDNGEELPPDDSPDDEPPDDSPVTSPVIPDDEDNEDDLEDELPETNSDGQDQLSLIDVRNTWLEFSDLVNREKRGLGYHLEQGAPTSMENGGIEITFEAENKFDHSQILKSREMIGRIFRQKYGVSKRIIVQVGSVPEGARPPVRKSEEEVFNEKFNSYLEKNPVWTEMVKRLELKFNDRKN